MQAGPLAGAIVKQRNLPAQLREHIASLRAQYARGQYERHGNGVRFGDGSQWFANGYEVELELRDTLLDALPALGPFAVLAAAGYTYYLFDTGADTRWWGAAVTAVALVAAGTAVWWHRTRAMRAVARLDLGTLLLANHVVIISHGRYVVFERGAVLATELDRVGTSEIREVRALRYRTPDGHAICHLTGIANDPHALAELQRWIAAQGRNSSPGAGADRVRTCE